MEKIKVKKQKSFNRRYVIVGERGITTNEAKSNSENREPEDPIKVTGHLTWGAYEVKGEAALRMGSPSGLTGTGPFGWESASSPSL